MENVEKRIKEILKENKPKRLDAMQISEKLGMSYDTTSKYLRKMTGENTVKRRAMGIFRPGNHWAYRYYIGGN
jgi:predicted transcriptional regulator